MLLFLVEDKEVGDGRGGGHARDEVRGPHWQRAHPWDDHPYPVPAVRCIPMSRDEWCVCRPEPGRTAGAVPSRAGAPKPRRARDEEDHPVPHPPPSRMPRAQICPTRRHPAARDYSGLSWAGGAGGRSLRSRRCRRRRLPRRAIGSRRRYRRRLRRSQHLRHPCAAAAR